MKLKLLYMLKDHHIYSICLKIIDSTYEDNTNEDK